MMKIIQQIFVKRWKPILEEYEKIQNKVLPRSFHLVKDLCLAHHISNKELRRYYRKWQEGEKQDDSLLPAQRGARPGSRRTPKEIERNILKAYRRFGSNRYELVLLFKPYYLDKTPSPATMDRIQGILQPFLLEFFLIIDPFYDPIDMSQFSRSDLLIAFDDLFLSRIQRVTFLDSIHGRWRRGLIQVIGFKQ